ncbi:hypothetical protein NP493_6g03023 [Ridgeia piscesae]|uniref:Uncharacterized protein n=1 Tax=Ridgeia piscesae TaxID=27915 RepID=A0AAD9ULL1_RIDPI|nr:hypothetical protein NP493_6g03023 [Ridgeia piscesae]
MSQDFSRTYCKTKLRVVEGSSKGLKLLNDPWVIVRRPIGRTHWAHLMRATGNQLHGLTFAVLCNTNHVSPQAMFGRNTIRDNTNYSRHMCGADVNILLYTDSMAYVHTFTSEATELLTVR